MQKLFIPFTVSVALGIVGCTAKIQTPYQAPAVTVPIAFQQDKLDHKKILQQAQLDRWWTLFQDAQLNQLVEQVIQKNSDLAIAGITLKQAQLQAGLAENRQGLRTNASLSTGHSLNIGSGDNSSNGLSANMSVSYELDLFGKLANQTDAQKWEALATEQDLQATAQTLIAKTVNLYWQLAFLNERSQYAKQNLTASQKLYDLVKVQYKAGAVSGLDLTQAEQSVQSQKANLSQIQQQVLETRTALAVLLHQPVQQLYLAEPSKLNAIKLPEISAGLPAELIARRPDLQAAELRLRKVLANKDATKASYYPSISLTGSLGSRSVSLIELIQNPTLALGASLNLPFLQYNDMKKDLAISDLEYEKAIINYRKTLYQAFADVENALSARTEINKQVALQQRHLELVQKTQKLTEVRYKNGAIALKNVIDAQQNTRNAYLSWLQSKYNLHNAYVTLLQSLGGSPIKQ